MNYNNFLSGMIGSIAGSALTFTLGLGAFMIFLRKKKSNCSDEIVNTDSSCEGKLK